MRYELGDYEWTAIKPMLPNKPRGVRRANDRRVLNGIVLGFAFRCAMARPPRDLWSAHHLLQSLRSVAEGRRRCGPARGMGRAQRNPSSSPTPTDRYLLICDGRNVFLVRQNGTTGKSVARAKNCPAPLQKIFLFHRRANQ
jgi:hypothetical protein